MGAATSCSYCTEAEKGAKGEPPPNMTVVPMESNSQVLDLQEYVYKSQASAFTSEGEDKELWRTATGHVCYFPCYALLGPKVCQRQFMQPHELLRDLGELQMWKEGTDVLIFASHQWTAFEHPDPTGAQHKTLAAFIADRGRNRGQLTSILDVMVPGSNDEPQANATKDSFVDQIDKGEPGIYNCDKVQLSVWLDYWSIPQARKELQNPAIRSIAAYAVSATLFVVVAPPLKHVDTGERCDLASCRERGWCRLEELAFGLKDDTTKSPPQICVLENLKGRSREDHVKTSIRIRTPLSAVLRGKFSCCERSHMRDDGSPIPCDKILVDQVVRSIHEGVIGSLFEQGDLPTWRRVKSTRWAFVAEEPTRWPVKQFMEEMKVADVKEPLEGGMFALHYAACANDSVAVQGLLDLNADTECRDGGGCTPLLLAAMADSAQASAVLLNAGADINARNSIGGAPVLATTVTGSLEVLKLLLARGADLQVRTSIDGPTPFLRGLTALHHAAAFGHQAVVDVLLPARSDPEAIAGEGGPLAGCNAPEISMKCGHRLVFKALDI